MEPHVVRRIGVAIREHALKYGLTAFTVELHGGEPLLLGKPRMVALLECLLREAGAVQLDFLLQTNGLLLDEGWLEVFSKYDVKFGISIDGPPSVADKVRVRRNGKGSTSELLKIISGLRQLESFQRLFGGALCVIDPSQHGGHLLDWFKDAGFRSVDFLLPDAALNNLPIGWEGATPYGRFFNEAFERWYELDGAAPKVRYFEQIVLGLMGVRPRLDALGADLNTICVIETNGAIGISDVVRICGDEFAKDSLSIFDSALDSHGEFFNLDSIQEPCLKCKACEYFDSCRGGYLPHRFDGRTFDNPSLYCDAIYDLSKKISGVIAKELGCISVVTPTSPALENFANKGKRDVAC